MRINNFSGGLNTRLAAHAVDAKFARVFNNVDYASGELKPLADKLIESNTQGIKRYSYWFEADQEWVGKDNPTAFVEFQEKLYTADGVAPKKRKNGVEQNLGIAAPVDQPTIVAVQGPSKIVRLDVVGEAGLGDFPAGEKLQYILVNEDSGTTLRSKSNIYTIDLTGTEDAVRLTNVGSAFATSVEAFRLYAGEYYSVGVFTVSTGTVIDNNFDISANKKLTSVDTSFITGTIEYGLVFYNSADGSKSVPLVTPEITVTDGAINFSNLPVSTDPQVDKLILYRIGGNLTAFTEVVILNNGTLVYQDRLGDTELPGNLLESANWYPPPSTLKYLVEHNAMLFGVTSDKLYFTEIGLPNAWPSTYYLDFPAVCTGISKTQGGLLVHTLTKTYIISGSRPSQFTQNVHSLDQGCVNHFTSIGRGGSAIWVSLDGVCTSNGLKTITLTKERLDQLVLDTVNAVLYDQVYLVQLTDGSIFFSDFAFEVFGYKNLATTYLVTAKGKLFGFDTNNLYELEKSTTGLLAFTYHSPDFVSTGLTDKKLYNKFLVRAKGLLIIQVYIDEVLGYSKQVNSTEFTTHELSVKKECTKGNVLRYTISGPGIVKEVYFDEADANG